MAAQKKSTGTAKKSSGGKKSASKTAAAKAIMEEKARRSRRNQIYAGIGSLIAAFFCLLGLIGTEALVLNWFKNLLSGLTGVGFLISIPVLLMEGYLFFRYKPGFRKRIIATFFIPPVFGGIYQMILPTPALPSEFSGAVKVMWSAGIQLEGGGVFSGYLTLLIARLISRPLTLIILILIMVVLVLQTCNSSLAEVVMMLQDYLDERKELREEQREQEREAREALKNDDEYWEAVEQPRQRTQLPEGRRKKRGETSVAKESGEKAGKKRPSAAQAVIDVPIEGETVEQLSIDDMEEPFLEESNGVPIRDTGDAEDPFLSEAEPVPIAELDEDEDPFLLEMEATAIGIDTDDEDPFLSEMEATPMGHKPVRQQPEENPLQAMGINTDLQLDLDEFPEIPDFDLEDPEVPELPDQSEELSGQIRQTSEDLVQRAGTSDTTMKVPEPAVQVVHEPAVDKVSRKEAAEARTVVTQQVNEAMEAPVEEYHFPPIDLLGSPKAASSAGVKEEMAATKEILVDTIESFGITANLKDITRGPAVARFEMELDRGVKLSKVTNLADDIALSLGVSGVRIAPVPDKPSTVGIEVPNRSVNPVPIRAVIDSDTFRKSKSVVSFALGKDIAGECVIGDISKLPHLLIAGTTGSGKSVCINSLLISLLYKASPEDVRLIMVDPKQVELGIYNGIPHLLIPVVTEAKKAAGALQWAVVEMTRRYTEIAEAGARKLSEYNKIAEKDPEREKMPNIVIVIDELADLMMVAGKEVEDSICRIAQLGRAAGMHLVVATQRPSSDVITGLMKSNIPSRISFAVASAIESRIILDSAGAEKLVGKGDMLYHPIGANKSLRVQGCLISDEEVADVVNFVKQNSAVVQYDDNITRQVNIAAAETGAKNKKGQGAGGGADDCDELLPEAVDIVIELGQASVSMLQRRLKLGYARAARLVDQMEERGYVGPFEGSKPRPVKITREEWAVKRRELFGENPDQEALDMNEEAAMADLADMAANPDESDLF